MLKHWNNYWFTPERPFNLGFCRAVVYLIVIVVFLPRSLPQWAELGPTSAFWEPLWLFKTLHLPVLGAPALHVMELIWKAALVLACLGLFTTFSAWITCILGTYLIALTFNYGKLEHQTMPVVIVMGILALSRCGDAFSLDAWLRKKRRLPAPPPSGEYRWPIRLVWLVLSITFFAAGIAKLRATGIHWAAGPAFSTLLISQFYDVTPPYTRLGLYIANQPWLAHTMAGSSLLIELLFPLSLFDRRARRFLPLAAFGMQIGIGLLMNIWFLQYLGLYVFWVPWDKFLPCSQASSNEPRA